VQRDDLSIVKGLIERGSSVDAIDHHNEYTPLHVSTRNTTSACQCIMSFLLAKGTSPTAQAAESEAPLHGACRNGNLVVVKVLLDFEPELIEAKSSRDWMALHFAACVPTAERCIEVSKPLLARGADIEVRDVTGWTALHHAIAGGLSDFIDFIWFLVVDKNAAVNVSQNIAGSGCDTPLHLAVVRGDVDIVRFLLDHGAKMEAKDSLGRTPLLRVSPADEGGEIKSDIV
jgi:ankyrin repeat protein